MNVSRTFTISIAFCGKFAFFTDFEIVPFFQKVHQFWGKKWTFWEIVIFQSHFTTILLYLAFLKNSSFFWIPSNSFSIKIDFATFWEFLLFLSHSTANLLNSAHFINLKTIFSKNHLCFEKSQKLNVFEKSYKFNRFLREVCYI